MSKTEGFSVFFWIILSHKVSRHFPTHTHTSTYANFENLLYICCTLADIPFTMQPQNQPRPVSVPPAANMPLPPYPRRRPSDMGSRNQVQAENASALRRNSSDSETGLHDIQEEPRRCIGLSCVRELAKFFMPTSDEEEQSCVNTRTR